MPFSNTVSCVSVPRYTPQVLPIEDPCTILAGCRWVNVCLKWLPPPDRRSHMSGSYMNNCVHGVYGCELTTTLLIVGEGETVCLVLQAYRIP